MTTELLFSRIEKLVSITADQKEFLVSILTERKVKRKQFLVHEGAVERNSYFVTGGLLYAYFIDREGKEHITRFAKEGWWLSDLQSFTRQEPAKLNIQALEDSSVLELAFSETEKMFKKIPPMERYFRVITEAAFISFQQRVIETHSMETKDRYLAFQKQFEDIHQRIPQKLIASYLGISPEFLSRIRGEMQR